MTAFRTKGRGKNRRIYPISSGKRKRPFRVHMPPDNVGIENAQRALEDIRVYEEERMTSRALTELANFFLTPIFRLFFPLIDLITRLFIFKEEQMDDELVVRRVEVIERELEAVASSLENENINRPEIKYAVTIVKEARKATRQDPIDKVRYAKGVYSALLKAYAHEVISNDYHSGYSETGHEWRLYKVNQDAQVRIDQAVDCLVKQLMAKEGTIGTNSTDLNKITEDLIRQCLESVKDKYEK